MIDDLTKISALIDLLRVKGVVVYEDDESYLELGPLPNLPQPEKPPQSLPVPPLRDDGLTEAEAQLLYESAKG